MPDHRARIEFDVIAVQVVGRQDIGDNLHRGQRGGLVFRLSPAPQRLVAALDEYLATSPGEAQRFAASLRRFTEEGPF